jgi:hypothetical protein
MDTPRSGFRRATAVSWSLAGLGIAGVAGASTLAYADTFKPPVADTAVYAVESPAPEAPPVSAPVLPPPPNDVTTAIGLPPPPPPPSVTAAVPTPVYTQQQPVVQAAAPITQQTPSVAPKPATTTRRRLTPATVMAPKALPRVTVSRGS